MRAFDHSPLTINYTLLYCRYNVEGISRHFQPQYFRCIRHVSMMEAQHDTSHRCLPLWWNHQEAKDHKQGKSRIQTHNKQMTKTEL